MMKIQRDWQTEARATTHPADRSPPLEFGPHNVASELTLDRLAEALGRMAGWCDVIVLHQHAPDGLCTAAMIHRVNEVIARNTRCRFLVDARHRSSQFKGAMLRLSAAEAPRACGEETAPARDEAESARASAAKLYQRTRQAVFVSQGSRGVLVGDANGLHENPLPPAVNTSEPASASETVSAVVAAVLAGGGDAVSAARLANLASRATHHLPDPAPGVTPDQIRKVYAELFNPPDPA